MLKKFLRDMLENASELCDIQEFSEAIILYDKILDINECHIQEKICNNILNLVRTEALNNNL